tara:strand:- start:1454 stop:1612 length:159 start_codon:yes stop_codon:yes gene_type:complete
MLVPAGKDIDLCKWILKSFKDQEMYKDHDSVQIWLKECEDFINDNTEVLCGK